MRTTNLLSFGSLVLSIAACGRPPLPEPRYAPGASRSSITVTSPAFGEGSRIPVDHTCDGSDVMPELVLSAPPENTKSLILYVEDPDASAGVFTQFLGWLTFGRVPALILLIVFLTAFGLAGILLQQIVSAIGNFYLPSWIAVVPAFAVSLPIVRGVGLGLERVMPKDHTEAVSQETFVGRIATIVRGRAGAGSPAEAKLTDSFGMTHYVLIEPDVADTFEAGDEVLVVRRTGSVYRAIRNTSLSLSKR